NTIMASLLQSANARHHHPVKKFIEAEKWDGIKRVERIFIDYLGVEDTEYTREVTKKWFTGAVARIYRPGVKFEIVPILSGAQGIGKSTLINKLAPDFFS
ncbi:VapE domain-containing protein, partial [Enterococcus faecalis]